MRIGRTLDAERITSAVGAMTESVLRNPDALLLLSQLRKHGEYNESHALDVSIYMIAFGRFLNLTDGSEKPLGEWNTLVVEARDRSLKVWVNGDLLNSGSNATADRGRIALQAEGIEVEFRRVELGPLPAPAR